MLRHAIDIKSCQRSNIEPITRMVDGLGHLPDKPHAIFVSLAQTKDTPGANTYARLPDSRNGIQPLVVGPGRDDLSNTSASFPDAVN